jgi:hypothetical protein
LVASFFSRQSDNQATESFLIQRHGARVVLDFFAKRVCQSREAAHVHPHRHSGGIFFFLDPLNDFPGGRCR